MEAELAQKAPGILAPATLKKIRHDLKTPLNQIIGYGEMLLEDATDHNEAAAALRRLLDSAQACLETQTRLLGRDIDELLPGHFQELKEDQTARTAYMGEILAELRAEPVSQDWARDLDRLGNAVSDLGVLARKLSAQGIAENPPPVKVLRPEATVQPLRRPASDSPDAPHQTPARASGRILVVDDNAGNRDMLSRRLEREGYSIETAEDGRQALAKLEAAPFDLVLLDIVMPELDGLAVLQTHSRGAALEGSCRDHDLGAR